VVVEELDQEARRERPHLVRVRRPDGGGLGHDHALDERVGDAERRQPLAQRGLLRGAEQLAGAALEARHVGDHALEGPREQVGALREEPVRRRARVLEVAVGDPEGHVGGLRRHAELGQQRLEARVVAVVEDDEARVDTERAGVRLDRHRVRVTAGIGAALEDGDVVLGVQQVGGHEAAHAAADDGDPHGLGV